MANGSPFVPRSIEDMVTAFPEGVNMGIAPLLLNKTQLGLGTNITVRGTMITQRPAFNLIPIQPSYPNSVLTAFQNGIFQGAEYYRPDNGMESMIAAVGGRLYQITPGSFTASIIDRTIPGDPNPNILQQAFMWQGEMWMVCNLAGNPIFFTQTPAAGDPNTRRSTWNTKIPFSTNTTHPFTILNVGIASLGVLFTSTASMVTGDILTVQNFGTFLVQTINSPTNADIVNLTGTTGKNVPTGTLVSWFHASTELPPGFMGDYNGQNWFSLTDGRQFVASDQVGASSGTQPYNYRDAVLHITQNLYLAGGGNFIVPGTAGSITAMKFGATLDASLGQGPLQVFTTDSSFSCLVPTDRLTWQNLTNPILPKSLIGFGAEGQWSTVISNSDFIFRSPDGIRSFRITRQDFNTWGNTPISREVDPFVSQDSPSLLNWASAIVFDNRILMTTGPVVANQGVYWQRLVALNLDPISSLRGKAASVYDGTWTGLNVLKLVTGKFSGVQRAFAFCLNTIQNVIELYEILPQPTLPQVINPSPLANYFDNGTNRIVSVYEFPVMLRQEEGKGLLDLVSIDDGELYFDGIRGTVDVQAWYRPDSWPCWTPWYKFQMCTPQVANDSASQPGYNVRAGLGRPDIKACDGERPLRYGRWFQFRLVVTGPHRFLGLLVKAITQPQSQYAQPEACCLLVNPLS
jgi:hypothetical protein